MFHSMCKDVLPHHQINSVIYQYDCSCGANYIGRTTQRLDMRNKQHVPTKIRNHTLPFDGLVPNTYSSAICEHLLKNRRWAVKFSVDWFTGLSRSHSSFHLKVLESIYIGSRRPSQCKQQIPEWCMQYGRIQQTD